MPYVIDNNQTPAIYVSASGEFGEPGGPPPPSYQAGLDAQAARFAGGDYSPAYIPGVSPIPVDSLGRPIPADQGPIYIINNTPPPSKLNSAGGFAQDNSFPADWRNMTIPALIARYSASALSQLPLEALNQFGNAELIAIGRATGNLGRFLSQFTGERLVSMPLDVLRELPDARIAQLPGYIQDQVRSVARVAPSPSPVTVLPTPAPPAPVVPPSGTAAPSTFDTEFRKAFGRDITPAELNDIGALSKLIGDRPGLVRLLPLATQAQMPSSALIGLSNLDLNPVLAEVLRINPRGLEDFPGWRLGQFPQDAIRGFVDQLTRISPDSALLKELQRTLETGVAPTTPTLHPTAGRPGEAPDLPGPPPAAGASGTPPPYAGPGQYALPRVGTPTLSADILSRSPLDQYYQNLGYGDFGAAARVQGAPASARAGASPVGSRLSGIPYTDEEGHDRVIPPSLEPGPDTQNPPIGPFQPPGGNAGTPTGQFTTIRDKAGQPLQAPIVTVTDQNGRQDTGYFDDAGRWHSIVESTAPRSSGGSSGGGRGGGGRQPSGAALIGPDLLRDQVQSRIDYYEAQIAALTARQAQQQQQYELALQKQDQGNQIALANLARQTAADLQAAQLARDQLVQRQAEFGVEASGMIGSQPTFAREQAISQADLNNKKFQAERAMNAASIALKEGDQREAARQFNIAQGLKAEIDRGQLALSTEIQRGQLGLATRSQAESERQGAFGRGLQGAQFQFQVQRDPASFAQKAFALRGQQAPPEPSFAPLAGTPPPLDQDIRVGQPYSSVGGPPPRPSAAPPYSFDDNTEYTGRPAVESPVAYRLNGAPPTTGTDRGFANPSFGGQQYATPAQQSARFDTTLNPLTAAELKANVGPGLANTFEGKAPGQFFSEVPVLSSQRYSQLLPSERQQYGAAALASGTNPDDLLEEMRRRSQTGAPPATVGVRGRRQPPPSLY